MDLGLPVAGTPAASQLAGLAIAVDDGPIRAL
jgi:hypothetical protein